ncbi:MAG: acetamidase/formamidase family protein [Dethiobacteria bacterium]|jgi:amidase
MVIKVSRDNLFFKFTPTMQPVVRVEQGVEVLLETHDCFKGQLKSEKELIDKLNWDYVNPATGPVFIEGVNPGDVLQIDLVKVDVGPQSTMITVPGEGALGNKIKEMETVILPLDGDALVYKNKVRIPKKPMIGVIGVAPAEGEISNGTPGTHGGNMDCLIIAEGTKLYLTANVEGALFGCGDLHTAMGDGEIVVCGAETPGTVLFKAQVVDLEKLPTPFVETDELVAAICSAPTIDEAASGAIHNMADFLVDFVKIPINDAGMLMSLAGQLKCCQVVNPEKTVRFEFPKYILKEYGYQMP